MQSNKQNTANLVALAALCGNVANHNSEVSGFGEQLLPYAWDPLADAVARSFPEVGEIRAPKASPGSSTYVTESTLSSTTSSPTSSSFVSTSSCSSYTLNGTTTEHHPTMRPTTTRTRHTITTATAATFTTTSTPTEESGEYGGSRNDGHDDGDDEHEYDDSGRPSRLSVDEKIGIGVGFAIGIPVVLVSALTCLRFVSFKWRRYVDARRCCNVIIPLNATLTQKISVQQRTAFFCHIESSCLIIDLRYAVYMAGYYMNALLSSHENANTSCVQVPASIT